MPWSVVSHMPPAAKKRRASKSPAVTRSIYKKTRNTDVTEERPAPVKSRLYMPSAKHEMKFVNYEFNAQADSNLGIAASYFTPLNWAATGSGVTQCTGWEYVCKYLSLKYLIRCVDTTNAVRVMLVRFNQSNAQTPLLAELLTNGADTDPKMISNPNDAFKEKYTILYDKLHKLTLAGDTSVASGTFFSRCNLPVKKNQDAVATAAAIEDGTIYLVTFSDSTAINHPTFTMESRIGFVDV